MIRPPVTAPKQPADYIKNIVEDIEKWVKSNMWPLSCYGFTMQGPSLPGLTDYHPDELREEAYQHRLQNGMLNKNYMSKFRDAQSKQLAFRERVLSCLEKPDGIDKKHLEEFVTGYLKLREAKMLPVRGTPTAGSSSMPGGGGFSFSHAVSQLSGPPATPTGPKPTLFSVPQSKPQPKALFSFKSAMESADASASGGPKSLFNVSSSGPSPSQGPFSFAGPANNQAPKPQWTSPPPVSTTPTSTQPPPGRKLFDTNKDATVQETVDSGEARDDTYSSMAELTPEDLEMFQAKDFPFELVPLVPPPRELCMMAGSAKAVS